MAECWEDDVAGTRTVASTWASSRSKAVCSGGFWRETRREREGEGVGVENTGSEERSHSKPWRGEELGGGDDGGRDSSLSVNTPLLVEASPSFGVGSRTGEESTSADDMGSSPTAAAVSSSGEGETGVGTDDVLGVGFLEAGKTTSIIMLDRVRRAAGPGATLFTSLRNGPGLVATASGASETWALDLVVRAGCNRLRLGRGGMV